MNISAGIDGECRGAAYDGVSSSRSQWLRLRVPNSVGPRPSACAEGPSACAEDPSACAEDSPVGMCRGPVGMCRGRWRERRNRRSTGGTPCGVGCAAGESAWQDDRDQLALHGRGRAAFSFFRWDFFLGSIFFFSVHADGEYRDLRTGFEGRAHRRDGDQMRQLGLQIDGKPVGGSPSACSEIFVTKGRHSRRGPGRQGRRHAVPTHMPASMPAARVCTHVVTQARSGVLLWFITVSQITVSSIFGNFSGACRRRTPRARSNPRLFRCYPPIRSSPRRSPSACPEKSPKIERRVSCCGSPLFLKSR